MKLKTYNTINSSRTSSGKPSIAFSHKSGVIRINKATVEALGIKDGDKFAISQDEENVKDWYLHLDKENGFAVRVSDKNDGLFNSKQICEDVRACVKNLDETKSVKMLLVIEPVMDNKLKCYPILTSSAQ